MKRRRLLLGAVGTTVTAVGVTALVENALRPGASAPEVVRIGILSGGFLPENLDAFRQGLRDHGWVEGQNIAIVQRDSGGDTDRLPGEARELVALGVRLIVATGPSSTAAAMEADPSTPVVMAAGGADPVRAGLIASFAAPGGRVTGVMRATGLDTKRIEILKEVVPEAQRLAFLVNLGVPGEEERAEEVESVARQLGMQLLVLDARTFSEIEPAFERARAGRADVIFPTTNNPMANAREHVVSLAARNRMPAIYPRIDWVRHGGLMGHGSDIPASWRRAAAFVDKILRGADPADLPVELSSVFLLAVNRKTLAHLGLTIPPTVLPLVTEWVD